MIDAYLFINLNHRRDRLRSISSEILKVTDDPQKIHRIDAVFDMKCGHIGCGNSHIKALHLAIKEGWDTIMMFEDDFRFTEPVDQLKAEIDKALEIESWDMCLVAYCNLWKMSDSDPKQSERPSLPSSMHYIQHATTTSCYIIRRHYFTQLLHNFEESVDAMSQELIKFAEKQQTDNYRMLFTNSAIDQRWNALIRSDTVIAFTPPLGRQCGGGASDNQSSLESVVHRSQKSFVQYSIAARFSGVWVSHNHVYVPPIVHPQDEDVIIYAVHDDHHTKMVACRPDGSRVDGRYVLGKTVELTPENIGNAWDNASGQKVGSLYYKVEFDEP
jgi:hypothetical protein